MANTEVRFQKIRYQGTTYVEPWGLMTSLIENINEAEDGGYFRKSDVVRWLKAIRRQVCDE